MVTWLILYGLNWVLINIIFLIFSFFQYLDDWVGIYSVIQIYTVIHFLYRVSVIIFSSTLMKILLIFSSNEKEKVLLSLLLLYFILLWRQEDYIKVFFSNYYYYTCVFFRNSVVPFILWQEWSKKEKIIFLPIIVISSSWQIYIHLFAT